MSTLRKILAARKRREASAVIDEAKRLEDTFATMSIGGKNVSEEDSSSREVSRSKVTINKRRVLEDSDDSDDGICDDEKSGAFKLNLTIEGSLSSDSNTESDSDGENDKDNDNFDDEGRNEDDIRNENGSMSPGHDLGTSFALNLRIDGSLSSDSDKRVNSDDGINIGDGESDSDSDDSELFAEPAFFKRKVFEEKSDTPDDDDVDDDDDDDDNNDDNEEKKCTPPRGASASTTLTSSSPLLQSSSHTFSSPSTNRRLVIPQSLQKQLYPHQREGVQWMIDRFESGVGGILGDDMGMGKTYQTLTLIYSLFQNARTSNALVLCPLTLVSNWENEARIIHKNHFESLSDEINIRIEVVTSDMSLSRRTKILQAALSTTPSHPTLVISTYGLVGSNHSRFAYNNDEFNDFRDDYYWNHVILDEGHKIKNQSTRQYKACESICTVKSSRLLLTGTPIQNNLSELHAVVSWATSGCVLGNKKEFKMNFSDPIEKGRSIDASERTVSESEEKSVELQEIIQPYLLQRFKDSVFKDILPTKKELVVFTHISNMQRELYESFLDSGDVKDVLNVRVKKNPLFAISYLKKLCCHPCLVNGGSDEIDKDDDDDVLRSAQGDKAADVENNEVDIQPSRVTTSDQIASMNVDTLLVQADKLRVLNELVLRLIKSKHRILIFSTSTKMLDIIERVFSSQQINQLRIDGATKMKLRQKSVDDFNHPQSSANVMLLSTKVGGLGLTLTGADRAIIYDPSWNPTDDNQAIDRCYRIGQKKPVTIYRLVNAGTVEECMYEKQIHKDGLRRMILINKSTKRYFSSEELKKLFTLLPAGCCNIIDNNTFSSQEERGGEGGEADDKSSAKTFGDDFYSYLSNYRSPIRGDKKVVGKKAVVGATGKQTFLASHNHVVGVTYHDEAYKNLTSSDNNGSNNVFEGVSGGGNSCSNMNNDNNLTPFASVKKTKRSEMVDFGSVDEENNLEKENIFEKENNFNYGADTNVTPAQPITPKKSSIASDKDGSERSAIKKKAKEKQRAVTERKIAKGDLLGKKNRDEEALASYFDVLERNPSTMTRGEKLELQVKIAKSVKKLKWEF